MDANLGEIIEPVEEKIVEKVEEVVKPLSDSKLPIITVESSITVQEDKPEEDASVTRKI